MKNITSWIWQRKVSWLLLAGHLGMMPLLAGGAEQVEGEVRSIDREGMRLVLATGRADMGELEVRIGRGDAAVWWEGAAIRGELVEVGGQKRLQTIWPNDPVVRGTVARLGQQLRKDTLQRGRKVFRGVGESMPRFALFGNDGKVFLSETLKGRYVVMNFIFTRCTMPTMCPAATERMGQLQRLAAEAGLADKLYQVSVTLDPAFDTPGIFTAYAADRGIDTSSFFFVGGPAGVVEDLKQQMGVLAEPDETEIIRHTMSTALIDPLGKIIYRIPGSMWSPEVFLQQMERDMAKGR
jgi:protein SCO1/2